MPTPPGAFHDFEQAGWQRAADHYTRSFGDLTAGAAAPLLDAAGVTAGARLLDVATGPGYVAAAATARGARVTAIDFSPAMLDEARRRYPAIEFRAGDAEALADADGSYDAVVASFCLLHLERPDTAIAEAARVLTAGGRYAFTVWAPPEHARGFGIILGAVKTHGSLDVGLPDGPPFFRFGDPDECRRTLSAAGLAAIDVTTIPLVWHLADPDDLYQAALHGSVRTAALLRAQSADALAAIRAAIRDGVSELRCELPMPAVLASATKR